MTTLAMASHITFSASRDRAGFDIRRVSSVRIESSWKEFTDKVDIVLPRNVSNILQFKYTDIFQNGDPVVIRLGYGADELPVEFEGYICDVSEGVPVTIRCEDEMYKMKRGDISISNPSVKLKDLLKKIAPGYKIDCDDMQLGAVRYANVAPIKVLEDLKKEAGLHSYFDGKVLRCGVIYSDQSDIVPVNFILENDIIAENLTKKADTDEVRIKAISILKNGKKISVEVGSKGGTSVQRTYINITAKKELEKQAKQDLEKYRKRGYEGSITTWGFPSLKHGMKLTLKSEFYNNMNGTYYIEKVVKTFDDGGYHQEITLGERAQ